MLKQNWSAKDRRKNTGRDKRWTVRQTEKILGALLNTLVIVPLVFGLYGLAAVEGKSLADALYQTVLMFFMNYGGDPPNVYVEIARWTALLADAAIAVSGIDIIREKFLNLIKYILPPNSTAVYGSEEEKSELLKQFRRR